LIEEEEAFQNFRELHARRSHNMNNCQTGPRYSATLQRTSAGICGGGNASSPSSADTNSVGDNGGERLKGIKNNFSRLVSM